MFCALCSENWKNGSNPGGRGKQWVEKNERKVREENGEEGCKHDHGGDGGGKR